MKCTSAEAAKMLRQLREEHQMLLDKEANSSVFLAAIGEDPETLRPEYDYEAVQAKLAELEQRMRKIKHALNLFNSTTTVEGMTIDEILVYLPQLQARRAKLQPMISRQPKQRAQTHSVGRFGGQSPIIDYEYANYDIAKAEEDYRRVTEEIGRLQTALDAANSTVIMEIGE